LKTTKGLAFGLLGLLVFFLDCLLFVRGLNLMIVFNIGYDDSIYLRNPGPYENMEGLR